MKQRQELSSPGLLKIARSHFTDCVKDVRSHPQIDFKVQDALMSGLAIFSFKYPSLLQFDLATRSETPVAHNLRTLYSVQNPMSDTQIREIIDPLNPREIRDVYKKVFTAVQRGKLLEQFIYMNDSYLVALDGTSHFSSKTVHCERCCQKKHRDGSITYHHQMLSGVLVHPQKKAVIPFAPEPILKQDGRKKNDCERNAAERFLEDLRREHPHLKLIVTEDGLGSNAPPIDTLKRHNMNFILGCKPGDNTALFAFLEGSEKIGAVSHIGIQDGELIHRFRWMHSVPLNDSRSDCVVNFIEYWEIKDGQ